MPNKKKPAMESVSSRADLFFVETFGRDLCNKWANSADGLAECAQYFKSLNPPQQTRIIAGFLDSVGRAVERGSRGKEKMKVWENSTAGVYNEETQTHRPKATLCLADLTIGIICNTEPKFEDAVTIALPMVSPDAKGSFIFMMDLEEFIKWMGEMVITSPITFDQQSAVEGWLNGRGLVSGAKNIWAKLTGKRRPDKDATTPTADTRRRAELLDKYKKDATNTINMVLKYYIEAQEAAGIANYMDGTKEYVMGNAAKNKIQIQLEDDQKADPEITFIGIKDFNGLPYGLELKGDTVHAIVLRTKTGTETQSLDHLADMRWHYQLDGIHVWPVKRKMIVKFCISEIQNLSKTAKHIKIDSRKYNYDYLVDSEEIDDFVLGIASSGTLIFVDLRDTLTAEEEKEIEEGNDWFEILSGHANDYMDEMDAWKKALNEKIRSKFHTDQCFIDLDGDKWEVMLGIYVAEKNPANESDVPSLKLVPNQDDIVAMEMNALSKQNIRNNIWFNETMQSFKKYSGGKKLVYAFIDMCTRRDDLYKGEEGKAKVEEYANKHGYRVYHSGTVYFSGMWTDDKFTVLYVPFKSGPTEFTSKMKLFHILRSHRVKTQGDYIIGWGEEGMDPNVARKRREAAAKAEAEAAKETAIEGWLTGNFQ